MSSARYIQEAVSNCTSDLTLNYGGRFRMHRKEKNPYKKGYDPDFDTSPELDPGAVSFYLTIIGI